MKKVHFIGLEEKMSISVQTRKILWGLSGNRCAFPNCNQELRVTEGEQGTIVGEECHIMAQSKGGPRFNPDLSNKQIDDYSNLILLCPTHHKIIDDNPETYTVNRLQEMKTQHETMVRRALDNNLRQENDNLYYESIVNHIGLIMEFDNWNIWTSYLASSNPMCKQEKVEACFEVIRYIRSRVWLGRYPEVENAIKEYGEILNDLISLFEEHAESKNGFLITEKFYKIKPHDPIIYKELVAEYDQHVSLVNNLVIELTRSANRMCDMVRKYVDDGFMLTEGKLMVYDICPEYKDNERYPGLESFKSIYKSRDNAY